MPTVDHHQVQELYADLRFRLQADPLFNADGQLEQLDRELAQLPATVEQLFRDTLARAPAAHHYAGLLLYAELVHRFAAGQAYTFNELRLKPKTTRFLAGDVRVDGDLELPRGAMLVVAGDLDVLGSVLGASRAYSLLAVGGAMTARNIVTAGELIVAQRLAVQQVVYLHGQPHGALAPALRTRVLMQDNRLSTFGKVMAEVQVTEPTHEANRDRREQIAALVGLPRQAARRASLAEALRQQLLAGG